MGYFSAVIAELKLNICFCWSLLPEEHKLCKTLIMIIIISDFAGSQEKRGLWKKHTIYKLWMSLLLTHKSLTHEQNILPFVKIMKSISFDVFCQLSVFWNPWIYTVFPFCHYEALLLKEGSYYTSCSMTHYLICTLEIIRQPISRSSYTSALGSAHVGEKGVPIDMEPQDTCFFTARIPRLGICEPFLCFLC